MNPNESLFVSWVGSFATIFVMDDIMQTITAMGTIIFTVTMIVKNIQEIIKKRNEKDK